MKAGFFGKVRKDKETNETPEGKKVWSEQMVDTIVKIFMENLGERDNLGWNDLERRMRTGAVIYIYI